MKSNSFIYKVTRMRPVHMYIPHVGQLQACRNVAMEMDLWRCTCAIFHALWKVGLNLNVAGQLRRICIIKMIRWIVSEVTTGQFLALDQQQIKRNRPLSRQLISQGKLYKMNMMKPDRTVKNLLKLRGWMKQAGLQWTAVRTVTDPLK